MNDLIADINYNCPNIDGNHRWPVERNNSFMAEAQLPPAVQPNTIFSMLYSYALRTIDFGYCCAKVNLSKVLSDCCVI